MSQGGIEEPYTIATVPKPLNDEHGQIRAASVYSLTEQRKRKRHEVVVGIDGECVNIYNVQTQAVTSTYALPPQTYLATPPCSIHRRDLDTRKTERRTYLIARDAPRDKRMRLICLREGREKNNGQTKATTKSEHKIRAGEVISLDVLSPARSRSGVASTSGVLVAYKNGDVACYSDDLSCMLWEHTAAGDEEITVEYSTLTNMEIADKGLFCKRSDISAAVRNWDTDVRTRDLDSIICQLVRFGEKRELRCFSVKSRTKDSLPLHGPALTEVMRYALPNSKAGTTYDLNPATGLLYEHHGQTLRILDISDITPKVIIELGKRPTPVHQFTRVSSSCVFIVSDRNAVIYETKFGSIIGSLPLFHKSLPGAASSMNSGQGANSSARRLEPVTSLLDLGLVVAISGTDLIALQVSEATSKNLKRKRHQTPVLADVLGKGDRIAGADTTKNADRPSKWDEWKSRVDRLISLGDIEALEVHVAKDLNITVAQHKGEANGNGASNGHTNGLKEEFDLWELPLTTYDPLYVDTRKASYLLAKMFAWRPQGEGILQEAHSLIITFKSRNILRWLARVGYLNPSHIERGVPVPLDTDGARFRVRPGDIMSAVEQIDQGFLLTCDLMSLPIHWDLAEVMQGLRLLIQSLEDPALPMHEDIVMTDVDAESKIEAQAAAASRELERLVSVVEDGPLQRCVALRKLIARLRAFPLKDVKKSMRSTLSQTQLIFLLRVLQVELHEGGWTSLYVRTGQDEVDQDELDGLEDAQVIADTNHNICTIAKLMDCAVDAIGTSGWLVGFSGEPELSEILIQRLRMQVSAAVTGCLEANNIDTYLSELCRTASQAQRAGKMRRGKEQKMLEMSADETMLPLGGNLAPPVVKSRGKKRQPHAETERVGKYTFERLRW